MWDLILCASNPLPGRRDFPKNAPQGLACRVYTFKWQLIKQRCSILCRQSVWSIGSQSSNEPLASVCGSPVLKHQCRQSIFLNVNGNTPITKHPRAIWKNPSLKRPVRWHLCRASNNTSLLHHQVTCFILRYFGNLGLTEGGGIRPRLPFLLNYTFFQKSKTGVILVLRRWDTGSTPMVGFRGQGDLRKGILTLCWAGSKVWESDSLHGQSRPKTTL